MANQLFTQYSFLYVHSLRWLRFSNYLTKISHKSPGQAQGSAIRRGHIDFKLFGQAQGFAPYKDKNA
jgi:hypothetical protein